MRAALLAIEPAVLFRRAHARGALSTLPADIPLFVVAAGKAAAPMTTAFLDLVPNPLARGVGSGPAAPPSLPPGFTWHQGGHPDPTPASVAAGRAALAVAAEAMASGGVLVVLLSGGASALLAAPVPGVTLDDQVAAARALMRAGVAIDGLNCVRKHLSAIKGGRLAAAAGRSVTLAISDVHAPLPDDPSVIGSGVTVSDPTTFADALRIVDRSGAVLPAGVRQHLQAGDRGEREETIKPGDPRLREATYRLIGTRRDAMEGAATAARSLGYAVSLIEPATGGESRDAGTAFVDAALRLPGRRPASVIASGETTVRVAGGGRGGRNQEFVLGAASRLETVGGQILLASVGTDGIDGPTDAAGAIADASTLVRARAAGLSAGRALAENDAYPFFAALGDLVITGPTGTNVGDLHVLLVGPEGHS